MGTVEAGMSNVANLTSKIRRSLSVSRGCRRVRNLTLTQD